jgi:hypothetical protein
MSFCSLVKVGNVFVQVSAKEAEKVLGDCSILGCAGRVLEFWAEKDEFSVESLRDTKVDRTCGSDAWVCHGSELLLNLVAN